MRRYETVMAALVAALLVLMAAHAALLGGMSINAARDRTAGALDRNASAQVQPCTEWAFSPAPASLQRIS